VEIAVIVIVAGALGATIASHKNRSAFAWFVILFSFSNCSIDNFIIKQD